MKRSNLDLVQAQRTLKTLLMATIFVGALFAPQVFATSPDFGGTDKKVCGFFSNINGLLNMASIAVVTATRSPSRTSASVTSRRF